MPGQIKLLSVNVGLPREVEWKRMTVSTGIFKEPVADRVILRKLNLDGDRQADLSVHGGTYKAVYAYPVEHYDYWRSLENPCRGNKAIAGDRADDQAHATLGGRGRRLVPAVDGSGERASSYVT